MPRGRAPHGLVSQLEEVDGAHQAFELPPLFVMHARLDQFGQRDIEHAVDLAGRGHQGRAAGEQPHEWRDPEGPADAGEVVELGDHLDGATREPDLLLRFAQGGVERVTIDGRIDLATRKRDLALVGGEMFGATSEHDARLAVFLEQRHEHRRRSDRRVQQGRIAVRSRALAERGGEVGERGRAPAPSGRPGRSCRGPPTARAPP